MGKKWNTHVYYNHLKQDNWLGSHPTTCTVSRMKIFHTESQLSVYQLIGQCCSENLFIRSCLYTCIFLFLFPWCDRGHDCYYLILTYSSFTQLINEVPLWSLFCQCYTWKIIQQNQWRVVTTVARSFEVLFTNILACLCSEFDRRFWYEWC